MFDAVAQQFYPTQCEDDEAVLKTVAMPNHTRCPLARQATEVSRQAFRAWCQMTSSDVLLRPSPRPGDPPNWLFDDEETNEQSTVCVGLHEGWLQ